MSDDRQRVEEREVFRAFLLARGIEMDELRLDQPRPPRPDVAYRMPREGTTAFELVEIRDERSTRRLSVSLSAERALRDAWDDLPRPVRDTLEQLAVSVAFRRNASRRRVESAVLELAHLVGRDAYRSPDTFRSVAVLNECVEYLHVRPGDYWPAGIHVSSVDHYGDPVIARTEEKRGKRYESEYPIELLAWYGSQGGETFEIGRRECLSELARGKLRDGPFRRIWVFSREREQMLALHPESDAARLGVSLFRQRL